MGDSSDSMGECAVLVVDIPAVGSYWLVVGSQPGIEEEGEYEITISCVDTLAADVNTTTVGCAETIFGTTGTGTNGGSGQRMYELEVDEPSGVTLATSCPAGRNELDDDRNPRTFLAIYKNNLEYSSRRNGRAGVNGTCSGRANCTGTASSVGEDPFAFLDEEEHARESLIADSGRSVGCGAVLTAHLDGPGSYTIVVTSSDPDQVFELRVACTAPRLPAVDETCLYEYMTCGDSGMLGSYPLPPKALSLYLTLAPLHRSTTSPTTPPIHHLVIGSTLDKPGYGTGTGAGEDTYLIAVDEPTDLVATTCSDWTSYSTYLWLFEGPPHNSTLVAESSHGVGCSVLLAELPAEGAYYLVVGGQKSTDEGLYELQVHCSSLAITTIDETCAYNYMTCSDSITGTNVNFPNFADGGRGGGAVQYLVAVESPTYLAATTCSPSTSFATRVRLFDASPTLGNASLLVDR